jgi:hypothetical protein
LTDRAPEFEYADKKGTTDEYVGTVGTGGTSVPSSPGADIQEFMVMCDPDQLHSNYLEISIDGGTTYLAKIFAGGHYGQIVKGTLTQIFIKGSVSSVSYQVILNREPT